MKFRLNFAIRTVGLSLCFCAASGSVMALDLGGFFDKVKSDFAAITEKGEQDRARIRGEAQATDSSLTDQSSIAWNGSNSQIEQILETYGSPLVESTGCNLAVTNAAKDTENALRTGDLSKALMQSKVSANLIGGCYSMVKKYQNTSMISGEIRDYKLSTWSNLLGSQLATRLLLDLKIGNDINKITIEHAQVLLSFAKTSNESGASEMLLKLNKGLDSTKGPIATSKSELTGSVESIISQKNSNDLSFDKKFLGKTLTISGKISRISGTSNGASMSMLGVPGKNIDLIRNSDYAYFDISDAAQVSKVMDLSVGDQVKIRGVYSKAKYSSGVTLVSCEIVK